MTPTGVLSDGVENLIDLLSCRITVYSIEVGSNKVLEWAVWSNNTCVFFVYYKDDVETVMRKARVAGLL